jgi:hypothetical protein
MATALQVEWREVVRAFREKGLLFYDRRSFALDADIETDSLAGREALAALLPIRDPPPGGYARISVSLYAAGYNRPPLTEETQAHPRRAVLYAELETRVGEPAADHDRIEALVEWPERGPPVLVRATTTQGAPTRERLRRAAMGGLRERLEATRGRVAGAAVIEWTASGGARFTLRARPALVALADLAHRAAPDAADGLRALAAALEAGSTAPAALADPASGAGWLPLLLGRKGSVKKAVIRYHCPACQALHAGDTLEERAYDRRDGFFGEAGLALVCPIGHELARTVEESL